MSHLTDTVKRLEKEKDTQAAEIKKMKGFAKFFFQIYVIQKCVEWYSQVGMAQGVFLSIYCKFR